MCTCMFVYTRYIQACMCVYASGSHLMLHAHVSLKEHRFGAWAIISSDLLPCRQQWNENEPGSLPSQWCSLPLKGHVMCPGSWLSEFGFHNVRSGCFYSACISWGTCLPVAVTLTLLPSPGDSLARTGWFHCLLRVALTLGPCLSAPKSWGMGCFSFLA